MTINTVHEWQCPKCRRIFKDTDKEKLSELMVLHLKSHKRETEKWESNKEPEKFYAGG